MHHSALGGGGIAGAVVICRFSVLLQDTSLQSLTACVDDLPLGTLRHSIRLLKADAPVKEQTQPRPHGMVSGFHHNEAALENGFQLIGREQRTLHHLQGLAGVVLSTAHRAGQHRAIAQGFGQHLGGLTVGGEAAENGILAVVLNNLAALLTVVLFKLRKGLDNGYQCKPP